MKKTKNIPQKGEEAVSGIVGVQLVDDGLRPDGNVKKSIEGGRSHRITMERALELALSHWDPAHFLTDPQALTYSGMIRASPTSSSGLFASGGASYFIIFSSE